MSNVIPYFVLAVVALGFFAICYAVFSRGDGESQLKQKAQNSVNKDNHVDEQHDTPTGTESKHGDVTITHAGGTHVYTASIADSTENQSNEGAATNEPADVVVDSGDTSFNRRDGKNTHVENTSTGYSLALGEHNDAVTSTESNRESDIKEKSTSQSLATEPDSAKGEVLHDEPAVVEDDKVVTSSVTDATIVMTAVSDIKHSNGNQATPLMDKTIVLDKVTDELRNRASSVEDTIAMGESVEVLAADEVGSMEVTQMIGGADDVQTAEGPSVLDETRLFDASEIEAQLAAASLVDEEVPTGQWARAAHEDKCVELAIAPFVHAFGVLHGDTQYYVEDITRDALAALNITKLAEVNALLDNIVIQEALMSMQKAYAATNTEWMKSAALGAFLDVVQSPKSSTPYLVAFDALRVLPHLTLGHFQVMALTLLLQYSRNSNNYGLIHFQHYVEKYIEPFISDLPQNHSFYRQLDYLRCTQEEREPITLAQVLSNSYPFVFNYRGFSKEELFRATDGRGVDPRYVVRSLNSNLYKLALVDESLAPRFFRQTRISDSMVQRDLLALMKSKPTAFRGQEARDIMDDISPVLLDLADVFDKTPMSKISLTLLGLYLGRAHVKATIGEEFDLSHWF
ncbi:LPO_1073/Vpar_1526 family protein [uncultured Veillonella sp.]|uniref:LPO_1073/Vpar_1526 family protein n=1 Tax=uncultured Veillonella sp. TaxID=159268 RepID=UPI0025DD5F1E|nr:LPO_1073/Vpar_1526 family protein [uncultured Veillonella sp.]